MPKFREKVSPPIEVEVDIYDANQGHVAVAPGSFHEDPNIVGILLQGEEKQPKHVRQGDAIISYPNYIYAVMPPGDVSAFFEPVEGTNALPSSSTAETVSDE